MKFTFRLVGAIWISALIVVAGFAFFQIQEERHRLLNDLERRAVLLGEGLREAVEPALARGSTARLERLLKKFGTPKRGIAVYDKFASLIAATSDLAPVLPPSLPEISEAIAGGSVQKGLRRISDKKIYVYATPL